MLCQTSTQQTASVEGQPSDCGPSPSRSDPRLSEWLRFAVRVETAKELAWLLAIDPKLSPLDKRRLLRFAPGDQGIILSARGKLRAYLPPILQRYAENLPQSSELWRTQTSHADQFKLADWRQRAFGAAADRRELYDSRGRFGIEVAVPVPHHVAGVFGRIEASLAKKAGVTTKTLRNWANRAIEEGLIAPRRLLIDIDKDGRFVFIGPSGTLRTWVRTEEGRIIYEPRPKSDGPKNKPKRWSRR
jgi:hypothetical protein